MALLALLPLLLGMPPMILLLHVVLDQSKHLAIVKRALVVASKDSR